MFYSSIKEINRLLRKGMSNLLKSYYSERLTFSKRQFSKLKKLVTKSFFGELQLTQVKLFVLT